MGVKSALDSFFQYIILIKINLTASAISNFNMILPDFTYKVGINP